MALLPGGEFVDSCACGCGEQCNPGSIFIMGHNMRVKNNGGPPQYKKGFRYCSGCAKYYKTKSVFCPSQFCNTRLRLKPRRTSSRRLLIAPILRY